MVMECTATPACSAVGVCPPQVLLDSTPPCSMGVGEFLLFEDMQVVGEWLVVQAARACSPLLDFCLCFEVVQCGDVSPWGMGVEYIFLC